MVTWGTNQVHTFPSSGAPAAAAPAASAPAPSGFTFGSTTTPASSPAPSGGLFGSIPAPAPTGGLFGSTPAPATGLFGSSTTPTAASPAPGGSLFGTSAPAPATGLFGQPAPAPATGLFGQPAPAPSVFGSTTTTSAFGSTTPTTTTGIFGGTPAPAAAGPQIPEQAAMQAHMEAAARQEAQKLQAALAKFHGAYTGAPDAERKFILIVYTDISPEQRQLQWTMRDRRVVPPRPANISESDWLDAVVRNPDPTLYVPVALVGAAALQTRVAWQQERAKSLATSIGQIKETASFLQNNGNRVQSDLQHLTRVHANLCSKLLQVMRKVELARCMNQPLQVDEVTLKQRLSQVLNKVDQVAKLLAQAQAKAKSSSQSPVQVLNVPDATELARVFKGHRETLTSMANATEKDKRDIDLLKRHFQQKVPPPPPTR